MERSAALLTIVAMVMFKQMDNPAYVTCIRWPIKKTPIKIQREFHKIRTDIFKAVTVKNTDF
jgi:hypothetical protein